MNLTDAIKQARQSLLSWGKEVATERWQDVKDPPAFLEMLNLHLTADMAQDPLEASNLTSAWQPWASVHFAERVSGVPHNPPPSTALWLPGNEKHTSDGKFSHTYPERMASSGLHTGIRFEVGDLSHAVQLLKQEPMTRQCYIPIWFPEDLVAATKGERVPCTFGWHFIIRDSKMYCFYAMRSCDAYRHFHNDLYFANMLALWLRDQTGLDVEMGTLTFHAVSFHIFMNDKYGFERSIR